MITYLIKTLLCAGVMFLIYFLFLEREKMYRFNRFYLLFSVVFSFSVSFIAIRSQSPVGMVQEMIVPVKPVPVEPAPSVLAQSPVQTPVQTPAGDTQLLPNLLLGLYLCGTGFFLFRFIRNFLMLLFKARRNSSVAWHKARLILVDDTPLPYSFLHYIFLDKDKFERALIEKEILQHELTHVSQKHSLDILLVEMLTVFAWINPLLFLFRRAIMLNHEYLADEAVLNTYRDTKTYQQLLYDKVSQTNYLVLSSPFNYFITKKRLIMMTKKTSQKVAVLKQIVLLPLIVAIAFLFSTRVIAQDHSKQPAKQNQGKLSTKDAPQSVIDEYHAILDKYKIKFVPKPGVKLSPEQLAKPNYYKDYQLYTINSDTTQQISDADGARMVELYDQMSKKQKCHETFIFTKKPELLTKMVPTKEQLEAWKNPGIYGIWVGAAKRIKNTVLNNYKNTDFYHYALRKLDNRSAKIMKYQIEVALMTKDQFAYNKAYIEGVWKRHPYGKYEVFCMLTRADKIAELDAGE